MNGAFNNLFTFEINKMDRDRGCMQMSRVGLGERRFQWKQLQDQEDLGRGLWLVKVRESRYPGMWCDSGEGTSEARAKLTDALFSDRGGRRWLWRTGNLQMEKPNCWGEGRDREASPAPPFHIGKPGGALTSVFSEVWRSWKIISVASLKPWKQVVQAAG